MKPDLGFYVGIVYSGGVYRLEAIPKVVSERKPWATAYLEECPPIYVEHRSLDVASTQLAHEMDTAITAWRARR